MPIDYSRQNALSDLSIPNVATVVGTGAIGCWVAYFAALSGVQRILIYSIGSVKPTDIARFPFSPDLVGRPYRAALSGLLYGIRPDIQLTLSDEFRPGNDELEGTVFNCAASEKIDFDELLYKQCQTAGLHYVSGFYSGHSVFAVNYYSKELPRPSLDPIPAWAGSAALAGLQILYASATNHAGGLNRHVNLATGIFEGRINVLDGSSSVGR